MLALNIAKINIDRILSFFFIANKPSTEWSLSVVGYTRFARFEPTLQPSL